MGCGCNKGGNGRGGNNAPTPKRIIRSNKPAKPIPITPQKETNRPRNPVPRKKK
tara:strand:+ start:1454 stop:1615 length:162 start_codon:yes stop_codon:yes gene_type:complete